ncbi:hypothetical protein E4U60_001029 [Claviceps pazoutovae]|uniref:Uncharacterized protein n=1 Tax=Claviceps pazoutovae TaxID=1649127 RepID=A0A9P7SGQ1_9HYPO|nr:hypothetical protein E4U60_001029 [Claviceps pazoutovae]
MQLLRENKIIVSASRTSNGLYMVEHVQPDRKGYVDTGTTATEKGLSTAESDDVLMDDIAVETSGTPDNTTAQTIDEESENGNDGDLLESDVQRHGRIYDPNRGAVVISSRFDVDESVKGGSIDLKMKTMTSMEPPARRPVGRPRKVQIPGLTHEPHLQVETAEQTVAPDRHADNDEPDPNAPLPAEEETVDPIPVGEAPLLAQEETVDPTPVGPVPERVNDVPPAQLPAQLPLDTSPPETRILQPAEAIDVPGRADPPEPTNAPDVPVNDAPPAQLSLVPSPPAAPPRYFLRSKRLNDGEEDVMQRRRGLRNQDSADLSRS